MHQSLAIQRKWGNDGFYQRLPERFGDPSKMRIPVRDHASKLVQHVSRNIAHRWVQHGTHYKVGPTLADGIQSYKPQARSLVKSIVHGKCYIPVELPPVELVGIVARDLETPEQYRTCVATARMLVDLAANKFELHP